MDESQLRLLFSSLAELTSLGPIPVQAYSLLVTQIPPAAVAEQLHQRWLADHKFAPIAANILLHMHRTDTRHLAVISSVLALLLNDYRNRLEVRHRSALMFRNSVRAIFAMYQAYIQIDPYVAKSLVSPMFSSLNELIDDFPEAADVEVVGLLLCEYGKSLYDLNSYQVDLMLVKVRAMLVSDEPFMNKDIRQILLHVIDLWSFGWNELHIPECLSFIPKSSSSIRTSDENKQSPPMRKSAINGLQKQDSRESTV